MDQWGVIEIPAKESSDPCSFPVSYTGLLTVKRIELFSTVSSCH